MPGMLPAYRPRSERIFCRSIRIAGGRDEQQVLRDPADVAPDVLGDVLEVDAHASDRDRIVRDRGVVDEDGVPLVDVLGGVVQVIEPDDSSASRTTERAPMSPAFSSKPITPRSRKLPSSNVSSPWCRRRIPRLPIMIAEYLAQVDGVKIAS